MGNEDLPTDGSSQSATAQAPLTTTADEKKARRWSKVESVEIENFKAIQKTAVPLGDVTILVGPNGSGKSSVLQVIHWAVRAASYIAPKNAKEVIAFDRIDYLPSSEPLKSAHRDELKSDKRTQPTRVTFNHARASGEDPQSAKIEIWAARNRGGITAYIEGNAAVSPYKQRTSFLTAYIPGLAGLSEYETILAQPLLRRQAASGDAGSVLRNVLFNLSSRLTVEADASSAKQRLLRLNELVQEVHPGIEISVEFDEREDHFISVFYRDKTLGSEQRSLETAATGVLQVVQIFAYLILFKPRIMLIDEPDSHLHPDKQERLIEALERAAAEFDTQIVLTTHSPHITRAATPNARLVWMKDGEVKSEDDGTIRRLLGWGSLDKEVLFFVEDEDDTAVRSILRQWPEIARKISVCRCFGIDNLPKDKLLSGLLVDGELRVRVVIHRDGDFMTSEEANRWADRYKTEGTFVWVTAHPDVEAYFCQRDYLAALYSVAPETAQEWIDSAVKKVTKARKTFFEKRKKITSSIWPDGGGPASEALWPNDEEKNQTRVLGKALIRALKAEVKQHGKDDKPLNNFEIPKGFELGADLREVLLKALECST